MTGPHAYLLMSSGKGLETVAEYPNKRNTSSMRRKFRTEVGNGKQHQRGSALKESFVNSVVCETGRGIFHLRDVFWIFTSQVSRSHGFWVSIQLHAVFLALLFFARSKLWFLTRMCQKEGTEKKSNICPRKNSMRGRLKLRRSLKIILRPLGSWTNPQIINRSEDQKQIPQIISRSHKNIRPYLRCVWEKVPFYWT